MRYVALALVCSVVVAACSTEAPVAPGSATASATLLASHSGAATLLVDDDAAHCPTAGYSTIQAAVDAADPNTTILVCAGTYNERVVISGAAKNGLRLLAQGAPDASNPAVPIE